MNDISELKKRAEKLARQIGLIQTEFRTGVVNTKIDDIGNVIKELRYDNDRLARENEGLNVSLTSLISAVEDSWFTDLPDTLQGVKDKMNAILETGRTSDVPAEATTTARVGVTADIAARAGQELAPLDAPYIAFRRDRASTSVLGYKQTSSRPKSKSALAPTRDIPMVVTDFRV